MTSCLPALPVQPRVPQLPALPVQPRVQPHKAHQLPASPALTLLLPANNEVEDEGDFLVALIFFCGSRGSRTPDAGKPASYLFTPSRFATAPRGMPMPSLTSSGISVLRFFETPSSEARLMPLVSRGSGVLGRLYEKSDSETNPVAKRPSRVGSKYP